MLLLAALSAGDATILSAATLVDGVKVHCNPAGTLSASPLNESPMATVPPGSVLADESTSDGCARQEEVRAATTSAVLENRFDIE
jgi:hypothetical protein